LNEAILILKLLECLIKIVFGLRHVPVSSLFLSTLNASSIKLARKRLNFVSFAKKQQKANLSMPSSRFCLNQSTGILKNLSLIQLVFLASILIVDASSNQRPSIIAPFVRRTHKISNHMPPKRSNDAGVLSELKETIQKQSEEISQLKAKLKQQLTSKKVNTIGHGGHGGGEVSEEDVSHYLQESFYTMSLKRVGWLGVFLGSLSFTALIMNNFEHTLEKHIELAYFVPLLAGHGGNTGGQTVGTVLSALSAGVVKPKHAPKVILKEGMSGILSGIILGAIVSPIAYKVMGISFHVTMVLFLTMPLVSTVAATLGAAIPFICLLAGLDPSVIAAPAMTSIVDVTGLMAYFVIANYVFKMYGFEL
jgi:cation transporter-like permease